MRRFVYCQCGNCGLRFPAPPETPVGLACPHCGAPTHVATLPAASPAVDPRYEPPPGPRIELLLDNLRSAFNVGSILRTADGVGAAHVHLAGITATPENPKVNKTGLSAEYATPWTFWPSALDAAADCRLRGCQLWALEGGPHAVPIHAALPAPTDTPVVLIAGNGLAGVDPQLLDMCERVVFLPMQGFKRSLNVAVATGIALYILRFS